MNGLLHFGDLLQIADDAGLGETDDPTEWLAARGLCAPAVGQYAEGICGAAAESGHPLSKQLDGVFTSGLTLGIAIAEAQHRDAILPIVNVVGAFGLTRPQTDGDYRRTLDALWPLIRALDTEERAAQPATTPGVAVSTDTGAEESEER